MRMEYKLCQLQKQFGAYQLGRKKQQVGHGVLAPEQKQHSRTLGGPCFFC